LWSADARGGVARIRADGAQEIVTQKRSASFGGAATEADRYLTGTLPNGLAFAADGSILISNFGTDCLEAMSRDGETRTLADSIGGQPVGKVNFVLRDSKDRIWITVSTRIRNWMQALRTDLADGYIARYEAGAFRMVADGFHFTNEIRFDAAEEFLYVVETTGGRITRLRVDTHGDLTGREVFGPSSLGKGAWPDGIAFDAFGNLWGTMVYSDKLFVLTPEGDL
jgi:sugar lactone lactonase YvrE